MADLDCGQGWSSLAVVRAFPQARVDGIDVDPASVADATRHAEDAGLADRVRFRHADATCVDGPYDLVLILEALHDMTDPAGAQARGPPCMRGGPRVLGVGDEFAPALGAEPVDEVRMQHADWLLLLGLIGGWGGGVPAARGSGRSAARLR